MACYRIYERDEIGRVRFVSDIVCATDAEANKAALRRVEPESRTEIWCGLRFVGKVSAHPGLDSALPGRRAMQRATLPAARG